MDRAEYELRLSGGVEKAKADLRRSWGEIHKHVKAAGKSLGLSPEQILQITRTVARDAELAAIAEFENEVPAQHATSANPASVTSLVQQNSHSGGPVSRGWVRNES